MVIRRIIRKHQQKHQVLGEESGLSGIASPFVWVIDPIDGTKQFVRGLPFYATQLAVMHRGVVILGISHAPALGKTLIAQPGRGTQLHGKPVRVSNISRLDKAHISHGDLPSFQKLHKLPALLELCRSCWGIQGFAGFWSYHMLACGKIDAVIEADTRVWNVAAASLIVQEAGGKMPDFKGNPLTLRTRSIVATNGLIHDAVLRILNKH